MKFTSHSFPIMARYDLFLPLFSNFPHFPFQHPSFQENWNHCFLHLCCVSCDWLAGRALGGSVTKWGSDARRHPMDVHSLSSSECPTCGSTPAHTCPSYTDGFKNDPNWILPPHKKTKDLPAFSPGKTSKNPIQLRHRKGTSQFTEPQVRGCQGTSTLLTLFLQPIS